MFSFKVIRKKNLFYLVNTIKKFGIVCTLKLFLRRLGISRITPYQSINFPFIGLKFTVVFRNNYWSKFEKGLNEINCLKFICSNLKTGQIFFDVGAWEGPFTLLCSKLVGSHGKVFAFDPDIFAFSNLRKNVKKNKLNNVILEKIGLSDISGKEILYLLKGGGQTQSTLTFHNSGYHKKYTNKIKKIKVPITTIDDYCNKMGIHPDGIKIDVEGAEKKVIEGCQKILKNHHPWVLMEFHNIFMPDKDVIKNWNKIISNAKKVIFIDGDTNEYSYGQPIKDIPSCNRFYVYLQY